VPKIVPIVEGPGEVGAVPVLLRRFQAECRRWDFEIERPKNAHGRGNLTKEGGLERFLQHASHVQNCRVILVIMDSEDECPKDIGTNFVERALSLNMLPAIFFVFPKRNFESWFAASLPTLRGLRAGASFDGDVENRGGKAILNEWMPPGRIYKETMDQAPMTKYMNFGLIRPRSRSFRRMENAFREIREIVDHPPPRGYVSPQLEEE